MSFLSINFRVSSSKAFVSYWLPVLLWMAVIFSASSDSHSYEHSSRLFEPLLLWLFPHLVQGWIDAIHYIFRKCGHLSEYAVLALLLWRAIHNARRHKFRQLKEISSLQNVQDSWKWDEAGLALSIVFLYAAIDEFHQIFVPDRTPLISDVCIDTCGGAMAILALWIFSRWRKKR
jgi:VanZ family protein